MNAARPGISNAHAWYSVVLLTTAYVFSFVDRYILGLPVLLLTGFARRQYLIEFQRQHGDEE